MDTAAAAVLARQLMNAYGLEGWRFQFDRATRRFGLCDPCTQVISLSRPLTELNDVSEVRDTILHEIAHALTPRDARGSHGTQWQAMARTVGCAPRRCYTDDVVAPPITPRQVTWSVGVCQGCHRQIYRRQRRKLACRHCSPLAYKKKFAFRWRRPTAVERLELLAWEARLLEGART
jgi:predicted SprT family Zn-dependent metalloprotease